MESKWQEMYKQKLTSPEEAVKLITDGMLVSSGAINGQPVELGNALANRMAAGEAKNVRVLLSLSARPTGFHNPEIIKKIKEHDNLLDAMYAGPLERYFLAQKDYAYVPHRLFDGPMMTARVGLHAAIIVTSPMDKNGYFSTGVNPDYVYGFIRRNPGCAIIIEVNKYMPKTYGNNHFHISDIAAITENDAPLVELPVFPLTEKDELIGQFIAERVPDGACLQLGIGNIPNAVAKYLTHKKDLGVHSEMLCDSMVDLYEAGAINCSKKTFMPRKWISSFAFGSQRLYDFIADNPLVEMYDSEFVNDPYNIGLNDNLLSINSTLEVDLSGQCASDAIGNMQYSGAGGQMDFIEGAWRSNGGQAYLALYSTFETKEGEMKSRIVPSMPAGAMITTTRNDVQYVVTEYGVAWLKGFNLSQRSKALINIAHPDFRDELTFGAKKLGYFD